MKLKPVKYINILILKKILFKFCLEKKFNPYFLLIILVDFKFLKSSKINWDNFDTI